MKKIIALLLSGITVLSLAGCSVPIKNMGTGKKAEIIKDMIEKTEENKNDVLKNSKLPKLEVEELALMDLFDNEQLYGNYVVLNYRKVDTENLANEHGCLVNVKKDNGVFVMGEFDDIPAIMWNDGKSPIQCFYGEYGDKQMILDNDNLTTLKTGEYKNFEYYVFRGAVLNEDLDDYTLMIDFGCEGSIVKLSPTFYHEEWGFTEESECDKMMLQVVEELLPVLDLHCFCCKK